MKLQLLEREQSTAFPAGLVISSSGPGSTWPHKCQTQKFLAQTGKHLTEAMIDL